MLRSNKLKIAHFRADYATHGDFCDVFKNDTKSLYLLAFLLTANHKESEKCFVSTVEDSFKEHAVFKEWARSWVKRKLIENAIQIVWCGSAQNGQKRPRGTSQYQTERECKIDNVTKIDAFERFVFVLSILERYSNRECSLLLGCSMNEVTQARMRALYRLADLVTPFPRGDGLPVCRQLGRTSSSSFTSVRSGRSSNHDVNISE